MSLDIPRIRALCFDVDGTLSDTDDYYVDGFSAWLRHIPFVRDPARIGRRLVMWMESPGNALLGISDTLGLDAGVIALINWMYRLRRRKSLALPVVNGVPELLSELKDHYPLAIISARDESSASAFLETRGLTQYFDVIITALSAPRTKPYPDPIRLAAREMQVPPESCLMIGDTAVDIRCGKSAGAQTVGVLCGFGEEAELRRQEADLILPTTADLGAVLLQGHE